MKPGADPADRANDDGSYRRLRGQRAADRPDGLVVIEEATAFTLFGTVVTEEQVGVETNRTRLCSIAPVLLSSPESRSAESSCRWSELGRGPRVSPQHGTQPNSRRDPVACLESAEQARPDAPGMAAARHRARLASISPAWPGPSGSIGWLSSRQPLGRLLPRWPDPDMALNNLERFLANPAGAKQLPALLEGRARTLETLLQLLQHQPVLQRPARRQSRLSRHAARAAAAQPEPGRIARASSRPRSTPLSRTRPSCGLSAAFASGRSCASAPTTSSAIGPWRRSRATSPAWPTPPWRSPWPPPCATLRQALRRAVHRGGPAGPLRHPGLRQARRRGAELQQRHRPDVPLRRGGNDPRPRSRSASATTSSSRRVVSEVVRLLSAHTDRGQAYRVDLRLRPEGHRGPLARSLASTLSYYDTLGRTWERQALIKVRPVAGDLTLGEAFLQAIEPFVYRKYLSFAEINEIKALKRRIEQKAGPGRGPATARSRPATAASATSSSPSSSCSCSTAATCPRSASATPSWPCRPCERVGCLTDQEYRVLDDAYRFLRKTEHRLQLLFDLQTHGLPDGRGGAAQAGPAHGLCRQRKRLSPRSQGPNVPTVQPRRTGLRWL